MFWKADLAEPNVLLFQFAWQWEKILVDSVFFTGLKTGWALPNKQLQKNKMLKNAQQELQDMTKMNKEKWLDTLYLKVFYIQASNYELFKRCLENITYGKNLHL